MKEKLLRGAGGTLVRKRRRHTCKKIISILCCISVFCTTCGLTPPAVAQDRTAFCGKTEHTHSEACYAQQKKTVPVCTRESLSLHKHTDACRDESGEYSCGYSDFVIHQHNSACYDADGKLWCPLPEIRPHTHGDGCYAEAEPAHVHDDQCYAVARGELICTEEEREGHAHSLEAGCYFVESVLICAITESTGHIHGDECYADKTVLTCAIKEGEGAHTHKESCYDGEGKLICAITESAGHIHSNDCYETSRQLVCGIAEGEGRHVHGEDCYQTQTTLICTITEGPGHQHGDDCYEKVRGELICTESTEPAEPKLICDKEEIIPHKHTDACQDADGNLICGKTQVLEHVHSDACFQEVEPELTCTIAEGEGAHTHGEDCYDENGDVICNLEENPGHKHSALCYGIWELTCQLEEHVHTQECFSDKTADMEDAGIWEATLPRTIPEAWDEAVLAVAESQLDYRESERNYIIDDKGNKRGYTRYGAWYGDPYGDWSAMFVSFCLHYAGVPEKAFPQEASCARWVETLQSEGIFYAFGDYSPKAGDLALFDSDGDGSADRAGLVAELTADGQGTVTEIKTIEGVTGGRVKYETRSIDDKDIFGYGQLPENPELVPSAEPTVAPTAEPSVTPTVEPSATPTVEPSVTPTVDPSTVDVETPEMWEGTLPNPIPENWNEAVVAVAKSQIGYKESEINIIADEAGNPKGYTRYGAWHGEPYADWNALFASFCLHYAGVPAENFPQGDSSASWVETLRGAGLFQAKEGYAPKIGDLIFMDVDGDGIADRVGVVESATVDEQSASVDEQGAVAIAVIEGDCENEVRSAAYTGSEAAIMGYGALPEPASVEYSVKEGGVEFTATVKALSPLPENAKLVARQIFDCEADSDYAEQYAVLESRAKEMGLNTAFFELYKVYLEADGQEIIPRGEVDLQIRIRAGEYPIYFHTEALYYGEDEISTVELEMVEPESCVGSMQIRLSALCALAAVQRPFDILSDSAPNPSPQPVTITNNKTIDAFRDGVDNPDTTLDDDPDLDKTDLYRLYLDAQLSGDETPVDLLIVIDESGSMHAEYASNSGDYMDMLDEDGKSYIYRDMAVRLALNGTYDEGNYEENKTKGLVYQFLEMNDQNQVAVVGFKGKGYATNSKKSYHYNDDARDIILEGWISEPKYIDTWGYKKPEEGKDPVYSATNYCAGLSQASDMLNRPEVKNNGHKKVMLFLSDGVPTLYLTKDEPDVYWVYGTGYAKRADGDIWSELPQLGTYRDMTEQYYDNEFRKQNSDVAVYTIGISDDINESDITKNPEVLRYMAQKGGGEFWGVESTDTLKIRIQEVMYKSAYSDLEICDTLSDYVDLYAGQPDYKVTMTKRDGTVVTLYENGAVTDDGKGKLFDVTYDPATKKVSAEFEEDYVMELGCTYTLSFNVKTSQAAYDDRIEHKDSYAAENDYYPVKGDAGTDYGTNDTSSGYGGYRSNAEAKMWYREYKDGNKGELQSKDYPHPVVQVSDYGMTVKKEWQDIEGEPITPSQTSIQFKLKQKIYYEVPPEIPETVEVNVYALKEGATRWLMNQDAPFVVHKGCEATFRFSIRTVEFTSLKVGDTVVPKSAIPHNGNDYTYTFPVTGAVDIYINYVEEGWLVHHGPYTGLTVTCPDRTPSEGGTFDVTVDYTRDHADGIYTIYAADNWETVIENLPKTGTYVDANGVSHDAYYRYEVTEVSVPDYTTTYSENHLDAEATATITITNKSELRTGPMLPETGGTGTTPYTMGGLLLVAGSILLYIKTKRRKEDFASF